MSNGIINSYIDVILKQIKLLEVKFSAIYIGGGTPTVLGSGLLKALIESLSKLKNPGCEFTIEANPESLDKEKIGLFLSLGINRVSLGVQSFKAQKLKALGRGHTARESIEKIGLLKSMGLENISIDLIFGVSPESLFDWEGDLKQAVILPVTHISCYCLTYEKNTGLFKALESGYSQALTDEETAKMYELAVDCFAREGFIRYEISNFAKNGYNSSHNLNYWKNGSYIALGPSGVSYQKWLRTRNISDTQEYINRFNSGRPIIEFEECLSGEQRAKETAALKIRTAEGIDALWFKEKCGYDFWEMEQEPLNTLIDNGLIKYNIDNGYKTGVSLTRKGFLMCDMVSSELL